LLRIAGVLRIALPHPIAQRLDWVMVLAERLRERAFVDAFEGRVGEQGSEEDPFILNAHL